MKPVKNIYPPPPPDEYILQDARHACLSRHPNTQGARLAALFHVKNGQQIVWEDRGLPVEVAAWIGVVDGRDQFVIIRQ